MRTADNFYGGALSKTVGDAFEARALEYLQRQRMRIVARNVTCRGGEIDLVMRDRDIIVFVEVRYRRGAGFGGGIDSVDAAKRAKLVRAAEVFLIDHPRLARAACRFDVLAIGGAEGAPSMDWRRNAFEAC